MAEVFTISGADPYGVDFGASESECANEVKVPAITGFASRIGAIPVGIYGVYRTVKPSASGSRAGGVVGLVAAGALWFLGGKLLANAVRRFTACKGGPAPLRPAAPGA